MNQQPTQPTSSASKGGSGTTKWLLIVLAIIVILGVVYFLYQKYGKGTTTNSTSPSPSTFVKVSPSTSAAVSPLAVVPDDWKTYENRKYDATTNTSGFSKDFTLRYPADWETKSDKESAGNTLGISAVYFGPTPVTIGRSFVFSLTEEIVPTDSTVVINGTTKQARAISFEDFITNWKRAGDPPLDNMTAQKLTGADNSQIYLIKYTAVNDSVTQYYAYIDTQNNHFMQFALPPKQNNDLETFKQILSTFKFTK